jgi:hypothetical protein
VSMDKREAVIEAARQLVTELREKREAGCSTFTDLVVEARLMTLAFAVRALDRADPPATIPEALEAGTSLSEAFEAATGRRLDLREP